MTRRDLLKTSVGLALSSQFAKAIPVNSRIPEQESGIVLLQAVWMTHWTDCLLRSVTCYPLVGEFDETRHIEFPGEYKSIFLPDTVPAQKNYNHTAWIPLGKQLLLEYENGLYRIQVRSEFASQVTAARWKQWVPYMRTHLKTFARAPRILTPADGVMSRG